MMNTLASVHGHRPSKFPMADMTKRSSRCVALKEGTDGQITKLAEAGVSGFFQAACRKGTDHLAVRRLVLDLRRKSRAEPPRVLPCEGQGGQDGAIAAGSGNQHDCGTRADFVGLCEPEIL